MMCDQYDALRSSRPYKSAYSHERVMEILIQGDGRTNPGHFSPDLLKVFRHFQDVLEGVYGSELAEETGFPVGLVLD